MGTTRTANRLATLFCIACLFHASSSVARGGDVAIVGTGPIVVPDLSVETVETLLDGHEPDIAVDLADLLQRGLQGEALPSCAWVDEEQRFRSTVYWYGFEQCPAGEGASHLITGVARVAERRLNNVIELDISVEPNMDSSSGEEWLLITAGQEWLLTPAGQEWLLTPAGQIWLYTPACGSINGPVLEDVEHPRLGEAPSIRPCNGTPIAAMLSDAEY